MTAPVRWARATAAVAVLAALVGWAGPTAAQSPPSGSQSPGSQSSASPSSGGASVEIVSQPSFVPPTADVYEIQLRTSGVPPDAVVAVNRYDDVSNAADPRARLDAWVAGVPRGAVPNDELAPAPLPDDGILRIPISRDTRRSNPGFTITDPGVFPIVVRLSAPDGRALGEARTFLIRLPDGADLRDAPPLSVAPVIGIRAPVTLHPDGSRGMERGDLERLARTQSLLATYDSVPLSVDPLPETVAALGAFGGSVGITTESLRTAIDDRPVMATTLVEIDVDQWVAAGLRDQLERQRQLAIEALGPSGALRPARPTTGDTWVVRHPLGPEARAMLQELNATPVTRLAVPAGQVGRVEGRGLSVADATDAALAPFDIAHPGGRTRAVVWDERLSERLTATGDATFDAQATLADLAVLACGSHNGASHCKTLPRRARGVALVVPDDLRALRSFELVLQATRGRQPLVQLADLDGLYGLTPVTDRSGEVLVRAYGPRDGAAVNLLGDYARRLDQTAAKVRAFRSMLVTPAPDPADTSRPPADIDPNVAAVPADLLLQRLDVAGAVGIPGAPFSYLDAVRAEIDEVLAGIEAPRHAPITLTDQAGQVQVRLENRLEHAVTVEVQLTSDKPLFVEGGRSTTVRRRLPPGASSTADVRVMAAGSGDYPIEVRVLSPDQGVVLLTTRIEVRSTVVSRLGLVLTIAAGVFLAIWWARHFRDARRARKLVGVDEVDAAVAIATGEVPAVARDGGAEDRDRRPVG